MKSIALCVLLTPVVAGGGLALWPQPPNALLPSPSLREAAVVALAVAANALPAPKAVTQTVVEGGIDLQAAVQQGILTADFRGNGRDQMRAVVTNRTGSPLTVRVPVGQMFEAASNVVVVARAGEIELPPGRVMEVTITTVATRSANKVAEATYQLSFGTLPALGTFLAYVQERPEMTVGAIQTAVLALTENLPLSSVAKFIAAGGDLETRFDTASFKTGAGDILMALSALRAIGTPEEGLTMTVDPQLRIECMIEPTTRAAAMQYYGISSESEWEWWKAELLSGEPTTRHYALYGIARFYPEVALEMLPKWARETKTQKILRISAIQALGETLRPEALPVLQRLADDFGPDTELGRQAASAAKYLSFHLAKVAADRATVAFRSQANVSRF